MSESSTIGWERDDDGVVVLTLDDPNQSTNTMNAAYAESIKASVDRLEAERDQITGVIITSAKKTFFAGGDLNDLTGAPRGGDRGAVGGDREVRPLRKGGAAPAGDARQAGRGGRQRFRAGRRPRDRPGLPSPDRGRRSEAPARLPRGSARLVARCRRRHPDRTDAGDRQRDDAVAAPGPAGAPGQGEGDRHRRRARVVAGGADSGSEEVDRPEGRGVCPATVGRQGLQDSRWHPEHAGASPESAGLPGRSEE